jgi:DUF4097 and DUF4098 domain-containing protein YvlB
VTSGTGAERPGRGIIERLLPIPKEPNVMKHTALILFAVLLLAACGSVVGDFSLSDGSVHDDDVSVVNGSISIGKDCQVNGEVSSVNGSIEIGANSIVGELSAVNGGISLAEAVVVNGTLENVNGRVAVGERSRVSGSVSTVNGSIRLESGAVAEGTVSTVNGGISLTASEAAAIGTTNGNIEILEGSHVKGRLKVAKPQGFSFGDRDPVRVVIGANSKVDGPLVFERPVNLFVHDSAEIGDVEGAEVQRYSGDTP